SFSRPSLEALAQRVIPSGGWADLVLPDPQLRILHQIATQVRRRMQVYENWGFSAWGRRGLGVSVLFTGDSGVGKTFAAEVRAGDPDHEPQNVGGPRLPETLALHGKLPVSRRGAARKNLEPNFSAADPHPRPRFQEALAAQCNGRQYPQRRIERRISGSGIGK